MKKLIIATAIAMSITGYVTAEELSSNPPAVTQSVGSQKLATEFTEEGIKVVYGTDGHLDSIEVTGFGANKIVAEMDASDKLVEFFHGSTNKVDKYTRVLSKALNHATTRNTNSQRTNGGTTETSARELDDELDGKSNTAAGDSNVSDKAAKILAREITETTASLNQTKSSQGKLRGVTYKGSYKIDGGRTIASVYVWNRQNMAATKAVAIDMNN